MLATAIIVFREIFEASLVIGIVLAASRGMPSRCVRVTGGIVAGAPGAAAVAVGAGAIAVIGYTAQPAGIQVVFYLVTLLGIGALMRVMGRGPSNAPNRPTAASI